ncbi:hypothetical protein NMG29_08120 [Streptomyces cocklensis]|uniref:Uncharacterized protein n=1 Tax=Actinacidiphila cocklensis TaxID=887465 RepID=A0A9W4E5G7_9ACTN|nr:hypothetical protein [Actinacidiphila cocklensis]MDD1058192.1 hypothetical protein [Actinacidiphila cocklensis]WSX79393.1 hypothetical protein OH826_39435 [Streptomyces sp. NBC_00899]CAG6393243.1 conserved hypothetical protein [Actinacidiphila cocklensis]
MAVAGPSGPVMGREDVDRALARLATEHEAVESSLLSLQDHSGRRLLEGAELTGVTKERWAETDAAITALWTHFEAYTDALTTARELRSRRRWPTQTELRRLTELLRDEGVSVTGAAVPDAARSLTGPARLTERLSLQQLVTRMNGWYDQAMETVAAADSVWSALPARIDLLAADAQRVRSLAHSVGVRPGAHPSGDELEGLIAELTELRAQTVSDPLAFWRARPTPGRPDTSRYEQAGRLLDDIRREVEAVMHVRDDAEHRLGRLRDVLSRADRTLTEARSARVEVLSKILASDVPAVSGPASALHEQLAAAEEFTRSAQWHRLSPLLDSLEQHADDELLRARESLTAVTAPLAVRAELRGRLDAYRAKVARLGMAEDPLLIERYDQARRLLWSAPCDLAAAERTVQRYQQAVAEIGVQRPPQDRR